MSSLAHKYKNIDQGRLCVGQRLTLDGQEARIRTADQEGFVISFPNLDKTIAYSQQEMESFILDRRLTFIQDTPDITFGKRVLQRHKDEITKRELYCIALANEKFPTSVKTYETVIRIIRREKPGIKVPGHSSVCRWYKAWVVDRYDMSAQVMREKSSKTRLEPEMESFLAEMLETHYGKITNPKIYNKLIKEFNIRGYFALGFKCPSRSTLERRIRSFDRIWAIKKTHGRSKAREATRTNTTSYILERPLERVECDAAHFNVGILDDTRTFYIGSLSVYFTLCCTTRVVPGYAISVGKRGEDAGLCVQSIIHSVSPKNDFDFPYAGIGEKYVTDNGPGYLSEAFVGLQEGLGREIERARTREGWGKPFVESFIRTMRQRYFRNLKGYLGKYRPGEYQEDTLINSARYTLSEIKQIFAEFIRDEYHHTKHSGLAGCTPHNEWERLASIYPPLMPSDLDSLEQLRGIHKKDYNLCYTKGVFFGERRFHSDELRALYNKVHGNVKRKKVNVDLYINPLDAREITVVYPPTGERVTAKNLKDTELISFAEIAARTRFNDIANEFGAKQSGNIQEKRRKKKKTRGTKAPATTTVPDWVNILDDNTINKAKSPKDECASASTSQTYDYKFSDEDFGLE